MLLSIVFIVSSMAYGKNTGFLLNKFDLTDDQTIFKWCSKFISEIECMRDKKKVLVFDYLGMLGPVLGTSFNHIWFDEGVP